MTKIFFILGVVVLFAIVAFGISQIYTVHKAHSSFDNYYAFRDCEKLITKTDTYGICQTNTGATIKIVEYENKWYLDGDLPCPDRDLNLTYLACVI